MYCHFQNYIAYIHCHIEYVHYIILLLDFLQCNHFSWNMTLQAELYTSDDKDISMSKIIRIAFLMKFHE